MVHAFFSFFANLVKFVSILFTSPLQKEPLNFEPDNHFSKQGNRLRSHQDAYKESRMLRYVQAMEGINVFITRVRERRVMTEKMNAMFHLQGLLKKFPSWNENTIAFLDRMYVLFEIESEGLLNLPNLLALMENLGDESPIEAKMTFLTSYTQEISREKLYEVLYSYRHSRNPEEPTLAEKIQDLSELSEFNRSLNSSQSIEYGLC